MNTKFGIGIVNHESSACVNYCEFGDYSDSMSKRFVFAPRGIHSKQVAIFRHVL